MKIICHKSSTARSWQTIFRDRVNAIWTGIHLGPGALYMRPDEQIMEAHFQNPQAVIFTDAQLELLVENEQALEYMVTTPEEIPDDWVQYGPA